MTAHLGAPSRLEEPPQQLVTLDSTGEAIDARQRLLQWALAQTDGTGGEAERDPRDYFRIAAPQFLADPAAVHGVSWCGIFCLAGLIACGILGADRHWVTGKGFVNWEDAAGKRLLPMTRLPQAPGDIVVFGAPGWHHAIVHSWGDGLVTTLDGNTLRAPREGCAARRRSLTAYGYFSLGRLLGEIP